MQVFFKDPAGVIRYVSWEIGSPKPLNVIDTLTVGMIDVSLDEAEIIHNKFDAIPKLKVLPVIGKVYWHGDWARFIYSNL